MSQGQVELPVKRSRIRVEEFSYHFLSGRHSVAASSSLRFLFLKEGRPRSAAHKMLFLLVRLDVLACKFIEMWIIAQADLLRFFFGCLDSKAVTQYPANHPECSNSNPGSAMNKSGPVFDVICHFQKLVNLFVLRISKYDRDIDISQPQFFGLGLFLGGSMLAGLAEVYDCLDAVLLQHFQVLESGLSAGAKILVHANEISNRWH